MADESTEEERVVDVIMAFGHSHPDRHTTFKLGSLDSFRFKGRLVLRNTRVRSARGFNVQRLDIALTGGGGGLQRGSGLQRAELDSGASDGSGGWIALTDTNVGVGPTKSPLIHLSLVAWGTRVVNSKSGEQKIEAFAESIVDLILQDFAEGTIDVSDSSTGFGISTDVYVEPADTSSTRYDHHPLVWCVAKTPVTPPKPALAAVDVLSYIGSTGMSGMTMFGSAVAEGTRRASSAASHVMVSGGGSSSKPHAQRRVASPPRRAMASSAAPLNISTVGVVDDADWDDEESVAAAHREKLASLIETGVDGGGESSLFAGFDQKKSGLQVFRVNKVSVMRDNRAEVQGRLRDGCCYIIFHVDSSSGNATVHYWIGGRSMKDQASIAAYHATSFARMLRNLEGQEARFQVIGAVQKQEQGEEDAEFAQLFDEVGGGEGLKYESAHGATLSALSKPSAAEERPRLFNVSAAADERLVEVALARESLAPPEAVFILDSAKESLFVIAGAAAPHSLKARAFEIAQLMKAEKKGAANVVLVEGPQDEPEEFSDLLSKAKRTTAAEEKVLVWDFNSGMDILGASLGEIISPKSTEQEHIGGVDVTSSFAASFGPWLEAFVERSDERLLGSADTKSDLGSFDKEDAPPGERTSMGRAPEEGDAQQPAPTQLESTEKLNVTLYRVGALKGNLEVSQVGGDTLSRSDLNSSGVFIVDVESEVFVWNGKKSSLSVRLAAAEVARGMVLDPRGRPAWASFTQINQGQEPLRFKLCFGREWLDEERAAKQKRVEEQLRSSMVSLGTLDIVSPELEQKRRLADTSHDAATNEKRDKVRTMNTVVAMIALGWSSSAAAKTQTFSAPMSPMTPISPTSPSVGSPSGALARSLHTEGGTGATATWLIDRGALQGVAREDEGTFFNNRTFITVYIGPSAAEEENLDETERGGGPAANPVSVIYLWRGEAAPATDMTRWNMQLSKEWLDNWREITGTDAVIPVVEVQQRLEPAHFRRIFAGRLFFRRAGSMEASSSSSVTSREDRTERTLLQVRNGYCSEVSGVTELCQSDVYLLLFLPITAAEEGISEVPAPPRLWVYIGSATTAECQVEASSLAAKLIEAHCLDKSSIQMVVGKRSDQAEDIWQQHCLSQSSSAGEDVEAAFWEEAAGLAVPGEETATTDEIPSLSECCMAISLKPSGSTTVDSTAPLFTPSGIHLHQIHLSEEALVVVDGGSQGVGALHSDTRTRVFVWVGSKVNRKTVSSALVVVKHWVDATSSAAAVKWTGARKHPPTTNPLEPAAPKALFKTYSFDPRMASSIVTAAAAAAEDEARAPEEGKRPIKEVVLVRQHHEPPDFVSLFHGWTRWDLFRRPTLLDPWAERVAKYSPFELGKVVVKEDDASAELPPPPQSSGVSGEKAAPGKPDSREGRSRDRRRSDRSKSRPRLARSQSVTLRGGR